MSKGKYCWSAFQGRWEAVNVAECTPNTSFGKLTVEGCQVKYDASDGGVVMKLDRDANGRVRLGAWIAQCGHAKQKESLAIVTWKKEELPTGIDKRFTTWIEWHRLLEENATESVEQFSAKGRPWAREKQPRASTSSRCEPEKSLSTKYDRKRLPEASLCLEVTEVEQVINAMDAIEVLHDAQSLSADGAQPLAQSEKRFRGPAPKSAAAHKGGIGVTTSRGAEPQPLYDIATLVHTRLCLGETHIPLESKTPTCAACYEELRETRESPKVAGLACTRCSRTADADAGTLLVCSGDDSCKYAACIVCAALPHSERLPKCPQHQQGWNARGKPDAPSIVARVPPTRSVW